MFNTRSGHEARWVPTRPGEQTLVVDEVTVSIRRDGDDACLLVDGQEIHRQRVIPSKFLHAVHTFKSDVKAQYECGIWPPK